MTRNGRGVIRGEHITALRARGSTAAGVGRLVDWLRGRLHDLQLLPLLRLRLVLRLLEINLLRLSLLTHDLDGLPLVFQRFGGELQGASPIS